MKTLSFQTLLSTKPEEKSRGIQMSKTKPIKSRFIIMLIRSLDTRKKDSKFQFQTNKIHILNNILYYLEYEF